MEKIPVEFDEPIAESMSLSAFGGVLAIFESSPELRTS